MCLHQSVDVASASSNSQQWSFWKKLWHLPVPHKVRHFAWRACRDILPTKENLCKCRVLQDCICDKCGSSLESLVHLFWSCSREIWGCTKLPTSLRLGQFHSFFDLLWFLLMIESFDEDKVALVVTVAWVLWSNRNEIRHGAERKSSEAIVHWVNQYLLEYSMATESISTVREVVSVTL